MSGANRFDRTADLYAAHAANRDWTAFVAWCEPNASDRVLDVAGGPGALAAALVERPRRPSDVVERVDARHKVE